jgi:hypothetical protein
MFPVFTPYEEGLKESGEPIFKNAHAYLLWIRDTYIRNTPFQYRDVREIHEKLQELRPGRYYYKWVSLQKVLRWWRSRGVITPLDAADGHAGEHTLMWTAYYRRVIDRRAPEETSMVRDEVGAAVDRILKRLFDD